MPGSAPSDNARGGRDLRDAIVEKARTLLVNEGYDSLSMRRIAAAVGCSATSIYLHFDSKDELVHSLIDQGMERLHDRLAGTIDPGLRPAEQMDRLCRAYLEFGLDNPEYYQAMFTLRPERMARYPAEKYRRARRNLEFFADILRASGSTAGDAEVQSTVIWATLHGAVTLLLAGRVDTRIDRDSLLAAAVHQALRTVE